MRRGTIHVFTVVMVMGCGDPSVPPPPVYDPCETSSDCPPEEPVCGAILFNGTDLRRMCTTHCTQSDQCHSFSGQNSYLGVCVPVDGDGIVVSSFDDAICLRDCDAQRFCLATHECIESEYLGHSFCIPEP